MLPAINMDLGTRNIRSPITAQIKDCIGDLIRTAKATQRQFLHQLFRAW